MPTHERSYSAPLDDDAASDDAEAVSIDAADVVALRAARADPRAGGAPSRRGPVTTPSRPFRALKALAVRWSSAPITRAALEVLDLAKPTRVATLDLAHSAVDFGAALPEILKRATPHLAILDVTNLHNFTTAHCDALRSALRDCVIRSEHPHRGDSRS